MTESHLRRLTVIMRGLEEGLDQLESALVAEPRDPILRLFENDITPESHPSIRDLIARLRNQLVAVKQTYGLAPEVVSARRLFTTKLTLLSIDLTEATSRYLRAYGEVPKVERAPLDEQITMMRAMVEELNKVIRD
jgi:hypothetical protein